MSDAKEKGDALEYAVEQIEAVMHKAVPGLQGANATIERNKRFVKDGADPRGSSRLLLYFGCNRRFSAIATQPLRLGPKQKTR